MAKPESLIDTLSLEPIEVNLFRGTDKDGRGRIFGGLVFAWVLAVVVMYWVSLKPGLWGLISACTLASIITLLLEISVVWSIGAEPGLRWRPEPLLFALLVVGSTLNLGSRMNVARGSMMSASKISARARYSTAPRHACTNAASGRGVAHTCSYSRLRR